MGWITRAVAAGGEHRTALSEVEEGLFVDQGDTRAKLSQFWMLLVLSSLIAAGGVVGNSTPAVIGAMIVAPLATPIYGVALATVIGSYQRLRTALLLLVGGIAVNIALGVLVGFITIQRMPLTANPQIGGAPRRRCSTWAWPPPPAWPAPSRCRAGTCRTSSPGWRSPSRWSRSWPSWESRPAQATSSWPPAPCCCSWPTSPRS